MRAMPRRPSTPQSRPAAELTEALGSARQKLVARIDAGRQLQAPAVSPQDWESQYGRWNDYNRALLKGLVTNDELLEQYDNAIYIGAVYFSPDGDSFSVDHHGNLATQIESLQSINEKLELYPLSSVAQPQATAVRRDMDPEPRLRDRTPSEILERLANRFHTVARQLAKRHGNRPTLVIADEYDVQDLLRALLRIEFDDVRPEENAPSYAGGGTRMDFLLKNERIVVEAKCTREKLRDKEVGEELLVDIAKYKQHPDCKVLVCFVYDPLELIQNPHALEGDLSRVRDGLPVKVFVRPRH